MSTPRSILKELVRIQELEKGKVCPMKGGRYFNHQTWEQGRNVVRYVPPEELPDLQKAIRNYQRFDGLVRQYVDLLVLRTREQRQKRIALIQPSGNQKAKRRNQKKQK